MSRRDLSISLVFLALVVVMPAVVGNAGMVYRTGSGITDAAIKKQYNAKWFHYKESCNLRAKGKDRDEKCGPETDYKWVDAGDDFIDLEQTEWEGPGILTGTVADTANWCMANYVASQGNPNLALDPGGYTITATIRDKTTSPSPDANDGETTASKQMFAYQVLAYLNSSGSAGNMSQTVAEIGGSKKSNTLSLAHSTISVTGWATHRVIDHHTALYA